MAWAIYDLDFGLVDNSAFTQRARSLFGPIPTDWFKGTSFRINSRVLSHLRKSKSSGCRIAIITSRYATPESKDITLSWLRSFSIPYDKVIFRRPGDTQPDRIYKPWALIREGLIGQNVTKVVSSVNDLATYYARIGVKQEIV